MSTNSDSTEKLIFAPRTSIYTQHLLIATIGGVICQGIAALGLRKWATSEWLNFGGPFPEAWEGYTFTDFLGIFSFTCFAPIGFCLLYTVFQHFIRKYSADVNPLIHLTIIAIGVIYLSLICAFGWYWGWDILKCGAIGCINTDSYYWPSTNREKPEAGIGFQTTIGIPFIITSVALICTIFASFIEHARNGAYHRMHQTFFNYETKFTTYNEPLLVSSSLSENPMPKNPMLKRYTPVNTHLISTKQTLSMPDSTDTVKVQSNSIKYFMWFILYTLFLFIWWFFATYFPNNWEYYYPQRIAEKAELIVTTNATECGMWHNYTCPEHDKAFIRSTSIALTKHLHLKIFPSNGIFYIFLFLWTFMAVLINSRLIKEVTAFFHRKIKVNLPLPWNKNANPRDRLAFFTVSEISSLLLTLLSVYLFFHYWYWDHNYNGYWPNEELKYKISFPERLGRSLGQVAVFFFALLMFPAARNSPLLAMVGISWEASMQYHRWLGCAFFIAVMGHMFSTYWWYIVDGSLKDIYQIPNHLPTSTDNFTVPMIQFLTWFTIISIGGMGLVFQQFRRKQFDIFMFFHHFTYLTLIPAILWHAQASWEYIMPAVTIWFFDRCVRAYRSVRCVNLVTAVQASTCTGEKYHLVNMFNPQSIDPRLVTPQPIHSIHTHKNYSDQSLYFQQLCRGNNNQQNTSIDVNDSSYVAPTIPTETNQQTSSSSSDLIPISPSFVHSSSSLTNVSLNDTTPMNLPNQDSLYSSTSNSNSNTSSTKDQSLSSSQTGTTSNHTYYNAINVSGPGVRIVDRGEAGTYIELRIINDNMVYFPGHYAFINIAEISLFEWHPFTIASPAHFCGRSEIVFVIKTMGPNTWTQSLYNYVENYYKQVDASQDDFVDVPLTVSLDGPYGTPIDFTTYDIVILMGGGIGITPCKSIYESLLLSYLHDFKSTLMNQHTQHTIHLQQQTNDDNVSDTQHERSQSLSEPTTNPLLTTLNINTIPLVETNKRIHLMWSARDPRLFELMHESLSQIPNGPFSAQLYCDNPLKSTEADAELVERERKLLDENILSLIRSGRPDLEHEFRCIVEGLNPNSYLTATNFDESNPTQTVNVTPTGRPTGPVDPTSSLHGGFQDDTQKKVLIFVCGPDAMAKDAEIICQKYGWDYHTETFAL